MLEEAMFPRNAWYVAATADELGRELLGRTLLDEPVVLYRCDDGTPVALEDRCSHRFLPLSKGYLVGDVVQCGYHGMEYDRTGACVHVPGQKSAPASAGVRTFPICERWRFIWIWMGDPALADEALIPEIWQRLRSPCRRVNLGNAALQKLSDDCGPNASVRAGDESYFILDCYVYHMTPRDWEM